MIKQWLKQKLNECCLKNWLGLFKKKNAIKAINIKGRINKENKEIKI